MSNAGAYAIAGLLIGAAVAIGTVLYTAFQQRQEEQQYGYQRGNRNHSSLSSSDTPKSEKQRPKQKAVCRRCRHPLEGQEMERPTCRIHVFHADCVKGMSACPIPGCRGQIL